MTTRSLAYLVLVAAILGARTLAAQSTPITPDSAIGFRIVLPLPSMVAPPSAPIGVVLAILPAVACPMPVAKGNSAADAAMVTSVPSTIPPVPMPMARAGCRNPLAEAKTGTALVP